MIDHTDEVVDVGGPNLEAVVGRVGVALLGSLHRKNLRQRNLFVVVGSGVGLEQRE